MRQTDVKVIERSDAIKFESDLQFYLSEGWQILTCSCATINSDRYDFCSDYKAVLVKYEEPQAHRNPILPTPQLLVINTIP